MLFRSSESYRCQFSYYKLQSKVETDNKRIDTDTLLKVEKLGAQKEKDENNFSLAQQRLILDSRGDTLDFIADMAKVKSGNRQLAA